jgi:transposase
MGVRGSFFAFEHLYQKKIKLEEKTAKNKKQNLKKSIRKRKRRKKRRRKRIQKLRKEVTKPVVLIPKKNIKATSPDSSVSFSPI